MSPTAVPPPIVDRTPQLRKYRIETVELSGKLDDPQALATAREAITALMPFRASFYEHFGYGNAERRVECRSLRVQAAMQVAPPDLASRPRTVIHDDHRSALQRDRCVVTPVEHRAAVELGPLAAFNGIGGYAGQWAKGDGQVVIDANTADIRTQLKAFAEMDSVEL